MVSRTMLRSVEEERLLGALFGAQAGKRVYLAIRSASATRSLDLPDRFSVAVVVVPAPSERFFVVPQWDGADLLLVGVPLGAAATERDPQGDRLTRFAPTTTITRGFFIEWRPATPAESAWFALRME